MQAPTIIHLKPATLEAFEAYIRHAEAGMEETLRGSSPFLWSDMNPDRTDLVRKGEIVAQFWSDDGPEKVTEGLIHDWIGAATIPGATISAALALIQDYDNHKNVYKPEVIESRLLSRDGEDFRIYLRLLKKKVITVVLDTDHEVRYDSLGPTRWSLRSYSTRIAEVEDPGTAREQISQPDLGHGFLWRLYSYWRFQERDGGVSIECRAISLTRDIPKGLGWIIEPMIRKLPRESLINTLKSTREAVLLKLV